MLLRNQKTVVVEEAVKVPKKRDPKKKEKIRKFQSELHDLATTVKRIGLSSIIRSSPSNLIVDDQPQLLDPIPGSSQAAHPPIPDQDVVKYVATANCGQIEKIAKLAFAEPGERIRPSSRPSSYAPSEVSSCQVERYGVKDVKIPSVGNCPRAFEILYGERIPPAIVQDWRNPLLNLDPDKLVCPDSATPVVLSIVAYVSIGCELDLEKIARNARDSEYNPKRFAPLALKLREPYSTALVFRTGKMIISGVRSEAELDIAAKKYNKRIRKIGFPSIIINKKIQNISAANHLGFRVRLEEMARVCSKLCVLEYDMFPGLIFSLVYPSVKIILFHTGSYLMTGAKSEAELKVAMNYFYPIAKLFIKFSN